MVAVHGIMGIAGYHKNGLGSVDMELWNWKAITIINAHERSDNVHMEKPPGFIKAVVCID